MLSSQPQLLRKAIPIAFTWTNHASLQGGTTAETHRNADSNKGPYMNLDVKRDDANISIPLQASRGGRHTEHHLDVLNCAG